MHTHDLTLGLAFGLGALHALEPGHGKTAMLVYLSGEKKSFWHPLVMGVSSALSHSVSLIAIAGMVHLAHHWVIGDHHHENEAVTDGFRWISAALVVGVGLWMCWSAWTEKGTSCGCHSHSTNCSHTRSEALPVDVRASYSRSALLGIAFGLLPCPSAMAAYFSSISIGSPFAAYAVIGLFAAGIASSLTVVGITVQTFGARFSKGQTKLQNLPWVWIRAVIITAVGLFYLSKTAWA